MALIAPPEKQALLLVLAEHDVSLSRAQAALTKLPETLHITTLVSAVEEIRGRRHDVFIEQESIRAELTRAESDVELVQKRIASDTERLLETSSAKDAQGLNHELESLRARLGHLEEIELAVMERLEVSEKTFQDLDAQWATADAALQQAQQEHALEVERLTSEMEATRAARRLLVESLPSDLVELYERQRERYGQGASHLRGGMSSASGVALTESDLQNIRQAAPDQVVLCPDSNAILVRTAESGL